jgi:hypothetical protein
MKSLSHEKAVRADDDPTVHADDPKNDNSGVHPLMDATFGARTETADQLRQRTAFAVGGTKVNKRASSKLNCGDADAKVKRQAVREYRQRSETSEQLYICNRRVQDQLKAILDRVGMVQPLQQHIQTHVYNMLTASEKHVGVCKVGCDMDLSKKPPGVLAVVCTKVACEGLMDSARIPGNLTKSELGRVLDSVMRVPIRSDANQINSTSFAVKRLLDSQSGAAVAACGASIISTNNDTDKDTDRGKDTDSVMDTVATMEVDHATSAAAIAWADSPGGGAPAPAAPPSHPNAALTSSSLSPTARQDAPGDEFGTLALNPGMRQVSFDSMPGHDIFFKIRDAVWSVATLKKLSQTLRGRVFEQLAKPAVSLWAGDSGLPAEVAAILLLRCTLSKMPRDAYDFAMQWDALEAVLRRTCDRTMVSQTTATVQYERLAPLVDASLASVNASSIEEMLL